jgi:Mut7-C RNAse domain
VQAALLALARLAGGCLAGRRYAARGAALSLSLLTSSYALARRHYPATRARVATSAAALATAGGAALARLVLSAAAAAAVRDGSAARRVNGLAGDTLGRYTPAALGLWDAAGRTRDRLTAAGLTAALGVGGLAELTQEAARDRVPPRAFARQDRFQECRRCGKVFWHGTHWPRIEEQLRQAATQSG